MCDLICTMLAYNLSDYLYTTTKIITISLNPEF